MKNNLQKICILSIVFFLALSFSLNTAYGNSSTEDRNKQYRELVNTTDGIIASLRMKETVTENNLEKLENQFKNVFPNESGLLGEIQALEASSLNEDKKSGVEEIKEIRKQIIELGEESDEVRLSFIYRYSVFLILGVSFGLAIVVNMVSRIFVDWEEVNKVRQKQSDLQDELKKARKEGDSKKAHKLQKKQQEFMQQHMGTMFSPMKTMIIIIIPFIIVFQLLSSTYGGWVVAWLPFKLPWPNIGFFMFARFFKGPTVSLGFFGWYLLSYFGFSQLWRKILVPSQ